MLYVGIKFELDICGRNSGVCRYLHSNPVYIITVVKWRFPTKLVRVNKLE